MKCVNGCDLKVMSTPAGYYIGTEAPIDKNDPKSPLCPYCRMTGYMSKETAEKLLAGSLDDLALYERNCSESDWCSGGECVKRA